MAKRILGIDIGYDTLKLALVQGKRVRKTAVAPMPKRLLLDGRVTSPEAMGELIRTTMKANGIHCSQAAFSFSAEAVFVRNVSVPVMSSDQLTYNLPYEFRDYITDELKNYLFDYAMLSADSGQLVVHHAEKADAKPKRQKKQNALEAFEAEQQAVNQIISGKVEEEKTESDVSNADTVDLLAVAAPVSLLEETRLIARKTGLKLVKAAPAVCSYIGLIRNMSSANRPASDEFCIVDLGYQAIRMYMFKGTSHQVTRALDIGLSRIDDALADSFGVDVHLAHTYMMTNFEDCLSKDICTNAFNNIAVELMRALNFYRFSNPDSELSDIWLCGGGAAIEPLRRAISEGLENMKIHMADELISEDKPLEQGYALAQAIGTAQY